MSKQTAVEQLVNSLIKLGYLHSNGFGQSLKVTEVINQAKSMEKQQIIDARQDGFNRCFRKGDRKEVTNEQYFNETFNK